MLLEQVLKYSDDFRDRCEPVKLTNANLTVKISQLGSLGSRNVGLPADCSPVWYAAAKNIPFCSSLGVESANFVREALTEGLAAT